MWWLRPHLGPLSTNGAPDQSKVPPTSKVSRSRSGKTCGCQWLWWTHWNFVERNGKRAMKFMDDIPTQVCVGLELLDFIWSFSAMLDLLSRVIAKPKHWWTSSMNSKTWKGKIKNIQKPYHRMVLVFKKGHLCRFCPDTNAETDAKVSEKVRLAGVVCSTRDERVKTTTSWNTQLGPCATNFCWTSWLIAFKKWQKRHTSDWLFVMNVPKPKNDWSRWRKCQKEMIRDV